MIKPIDTVQYREEIISLWGESFSDTREYVEFFLDNCPNICLAAFSDGCPVSLLFLLDGRIKGFKVKYIYAACTAPEYRNRGFMSGLIEFAKAFCRENDCDGIFLVPAEASLYSYYERFGFTDCFRRYEAVLRAENPDGKISFTELTDIDDILNIRKRIMDSIDCFVFTDEVTAYSIKEHIFSGGKIMFLSENGNEMLIFVSFEGNNISINELLSLSGVGKLKNLEQIANNDEENIYIRCPIVYNIKDIVVNCAKCGMCCALNDNMKKALDGKTFYAGLYLD